jgi:murein DD-endopeptidase MepM/ murein hydrolase activator NlpD
MSEKSPIIEAQLPFDPKQNDVVISQGFDGPYSHNRFKIRTCEYDLRHALDFALPLGTTVKAVREGVIRYLIQGGGYYEGSDPVEGRKPIAASLIVAHPEVEGFPGTLYSHYQHLDPDGFRVGVGDKIEAGQPIAKTGRTGWIGEIPHLHVHFQYHTIGGGRGPVVTSVPFMLNEADELEDKKIIAGYAGDSRELIQKILAIRKRDGFLIG